MKSFNQKIVALLGSRWFFLGLIVVFLFQALWLAFSLRYPMAFDENYHFGIIQLYAKQWSPFFEHQPAGANIFGDVTRYPSYLFHYLMSFPYRLIAGLTSDQTLQIIFLRLWNIGFLTAALVFWRKIFQEIKVSNAISHLVLLFFILTPQVSYLAAQINYDNLLALGTAGSVWLLIKFTKSWQTEQKFDWPLFLGLAIVALFSSLVKYSFLPVLLGLFLCLVTLFYRQRKNLLSAIQLGWQAVSWPLKIGLLILAFLGLGLFIERHGYNLYRYHEVVPDCGEVIGVEPCLEYGTWKRNHRYESIRTENFFPNPIKFTSVWIYRMVGQPFLILRHDYATTGLLPLPYLTAWTVFGLGVIGLLWHGRSLKRNQPFLGTLLTVLLTYVASLWLLNFSEYSYFERYVAIQARYLIPLLPILYLLLVYSLGASLNRFGWSRLRGILVVVALLLFLQGGGLVTFLARTNPSWYWPQPTVIKINEVTQKLVRPLLLPLASF